jgi:serine/threonine protein kinase
MALKAGDKLGSFEIVGAIGAGGQGEVYKARDTRLDRFVAIKVLPAHLSARSELRERFEREARTVSSLNHPHICTLYDIGKQDGTDFLVMEYLEGQTLADRLAKGPLPLAEALRHGRNQYTVTADGQRFLVGQPAANTATPSLTVMVDWLAALHK